METAYRARGTRTVPAVINQGRAGVRPSPPRHFDPTRADLSDGDNHDVARLRAGIDKAGLRDRIRRWARDLPGPSKCSPSRTGLAVGSPALLGEAVGTVHRFVTAGLKRHARFFPAVRTGCGEHLALGTAVSATAATAVATGAIAAAVSTGCFVRCPAVGTSGGLIIEPLRRVEVLLPDRENKCLAAIAAGQSLVCVTQR
jgi:hypothetical protein